MDTGANSDHYGSGNISTAANANNFPSATKLYDTSGSSAVTDANVSSRITDPRFADNSLWDMDGNQTSSTGAPTPSSSSDTPKAYMEDELKKNLWASLYDVIVALLCLSLRVEQHFIVVFQCTDSLLKLRP